MSAQLSTASFTNSLSPHTGAPSPRTGLSVLEGLGAPPDSFSRALEARMRTPATAPREREPVREPERHDLAPTPPAREPGRSDGPGNAAASPEPPAQGASGTTGTVQTKNEASADPADTSAPEQAAASDDTARENAAANAAAHASAAAGPGSGSRTPLAAVPGDHMAALAAVPDGATAAIDETLPTAAEDDAPASPTTDPVALAGLPAAIAALLAGRAKPPASGGEPGTLQLASGGGLNSPHNPVPSPKADWPVQWNASDAGAQGSDGHAPVFVLQGRDFTTAAATQAEAGMTDFPALGGAAGAAGETLPAGAMQSHAPLHLLRQSPAAQPATPQLPVATPAGETGWAEDVGDQVRWMLGRAESKAELVLTPPNMGKLEVSISLNGDQTTAQFIASSQAARDALERAMPQLREALQQAGIMLGDANVSTSGQGRDGEGREHRGGGGGRGEGAGAEGGVSGGGGVWLKQQQGMVDTFA